MPKAQRGTPPYVQIQDHYRDAIRSGEIAEGARLPSIAALAEEWVVAPATAAKAIAGLQVEGYVYSSTQGTFATLGKGASSAHDRIEALRRGRGAPAGQRTVVTEAGIIDAPVYIAELLGIDPAGARVARRETIAYDGEQPKRLTVQWWPAELVPSLDPDDGSEVLERIERTTERTPSSGRDYFEGREADVREARALGVKAGDAVLASTYVWRDEVGVIEYGEFVLPRKRVVSFAYAIGAGA
jgi:DNA-binding GntR family transcriptional regulator